jgi:hypothetical protein
MDRRQSGLSERARADTPIKVANWEDAMKQFIIYAAFAFCWPLLIALIYSQLERYFPTVFVPEHQE